MDKPAQIAQLLRSITGTDRKRPAFFPMEVVSVDGDMCRAKIADFIIPDIRLSVIKGGADKGLLITPAVGSIVLVADMSGGEMRELAVIGFTEIEKIDAHIGGSKLHIDTNVVELNDGQNDGLVNVNDLVGRLNAIEQDINTLKTIFTGWAPVAQDGGAVLKTASAAWAAQQLTQTVKSNIEDTKVKH